ncbi:MAG: hypothetical protein KatS3mg125_1734 [Lysobacterales bacterium]|nr:MAG: hypothetical protein KatS3mg125_1734 [Xanthomonadales bacterium]
MANAWLRRRGMIRFWQRRAIAGRESGTCAGAGSPKSRCEERLRRCGLGIVPSLLLVAGSANGFSAGSPICEVHSLPLVEMSPTLADPPPAGWYLEASRLVFYPSRPLAIRLRHPDPTKAVRGVLLWAKSSPTEGAGTFELPANGRWQYMPGSSNCATWAISHTDGLPKMQSLLEWRWFPGATEVGVLRAFLIQDCPQPPGGCRDQQGLTPLLILERGIFLDDFEA